ncbi:porin [Chromobacterium amazonense]|uniref:Porin n=1 Tax=Chromobacterium amazonense TaxID=1382803 RepID=A0A2S9X349_9NEIS|nr:porin [Chromobacterium amazonense]MDQ4539219.1 porin [Chromobacterium amazonense]PRP70152.1 porin [Chromobacterium amazonense]
MKKTLIALAVATLPAAAFADVTIYGTLKAGVENVDAGGMNKTNIDDLGSRIGFKGSEDLGNGLKAIWQVESGFDIDGSNRQKYGTFASRESFVGLDTGFGKVRLGNLSTFSDDSMGMVNTWESSSAALQLDAYGRDDMRVKNAIRFDTANYNGFKAAFLYGTKEDKTASFGTGVTPSDSSRELYNLGLSYENSGFFGKYQFIHQTPVNIAGTRTQSNDSHRLEAGYNANNLLVSFGYRNDRGDSSITPLSFLKGDNAPALDGSKYKSQEYALTAAYTIGAFTPKISYAQAKDYSKDGVNVDHTGYKQFLVGVDYQMSKRTTMGLQYGEVKADQAIFSNAEGASAGNKLRGLGLNVIHSF